MDAAQQLNSQVLAKGEYETQCFGFSSRVLFVHLKDFMNELFNTAALNLQEAVIKKLGADENEVKSATSELIKQCEFALQAHSDDLQSACDSSFGIPDCVLLPEDNAQKSQYSSEEAETIESDLESFKFRLTRARAMKFYLTKEIEEFKKIKPIIEEAQNVKSQSLNDLDAKMQNQEQKLKKLSKVSKSMNSTIMSRTEKIEPCFPHVLVKEKFSCSSPEQKKFPYNVL